MFRTILVAGGVAFMLVSQASRGDPGLFLTWSDCALSPAAVSDLASDCAGNAGAQTLFCAFRLGQPIDDVIAVEITMDVQHQFLALPAWWLFAPGDCRAGALTGSAIFDGLTACEDPWRASATKDPPVTYRTRNDFPAWSANRGRMLVGVAVSPAAPIRLEAGPMYYAASIEIGNQSTLGCPGCVGTACVVLNSILIGNLSPGNDLFLETPGPANANWVTWQGGMGAACAAVPVRASTWGRIKSLYR